MKELIKYWKEYKEELPVSYNEAWGVKVPSPPNIEDFLDYIEEKLDLNEKK